MCKGQHIAHRPRQQRQANKKATIPPVDPFLDLLRLRRPPPPRLADTPSITRAVTTRAATRTESVDRRIVVSRRESWLSGESEKKNEKTKKFRNTIQSSQGRTRCRERVSGMADDELRADDEDNLSFDTIPDEMIVEARPSFFFFFFFFFGRVFVVCCLPACPCLSLLIEDLSPSNISPAEFPSTPPAQIALHLSFAEVMNLKAVCKRFWYAASRSKICRLLAGHLPKSHRKHSPPPLLFHLYRYQLGQYHTTYCCGKTAPFARPEPLATKDST